MFGNSTYGEKYDHNLQSKTIGGYSVTVKGTESWDDWCRAKQVVVKDTRSSQDASFVIYGNTMSPCPLDHNFIEISHYDDTGIELKVISNTLNGNTSPSYYTTLMYNAAHNTLSEEK